MVLFFFFQAEDGIRDIGVTGVQTCALPISPARRTPRAPSARDAGAACSRRRSRRADAGRSEERRVGKGVDLGWRRMTKQKTAESLGSRAEARTQADTGRAVRSQPSAR